MALVGRRREPFAVKDMAEVPTAIVACNLGTFLREISTTHHAEREVVVPVDRARDRIKERRPATPAVKLGRTFVQRRVAACTRVHTRGTVFVVLARTGTLRAFLTQHTKLRQSHDLPARARGRHATLSRCATWRWNA